MIRIATNNAHTVSVLLQAGRQLCDADLESRLHLVQNLGVLGVADEGDGQTLGAKTTSASNLTSQRRNVAQSYSVQIAVGIGGHVVVDNNVHALNVHAATKNVSGHENAALEALEVCVVLDSRVQELK